MHPSRTTASLICCVPLALHNSQAYR